MNNKKVSNKFAKSALTCFIAVFLCVGLVGCGNTTSNPDVNQNQTITNDDNPLGLEETPVAEAGSDASMSDPNMQTVYEYDSGSDHYFNGLFTTMEVRGIEEFESLESVSYKDVPSEGNVYVVLYIDLVNYLPTPYYFSPDQCEMSVDGVTTETTFLVNEPKEGYETIFGYVEQGATGYYYDKRGFLVIEAPANWQNLEFKYTGWSYDEFANAIIINHFTRADLDNK